MLPVSSASGEWTGALDALFTATSAVCVTGLVVVDTGTYWSGFGQVVILVLFQVGGVGFMTCSTALLLLGRRRTSLRERLLLREALGTRELGSVLTLARNVIVFTFVVEGVGAIVLTLRFLGEMDPLRAVWWGVFHAVSGFNNAGFDLFGQYRSLTELQPRRRPCSCRSPRCSSSGVSRTPSWRMSSGTVASSPWRSTRSSCLVTTAGLTGVRHARAPVHGAGESPQLWRHGSGRPRAECVLPDRRPNGRVQLGGHWRDDRGRPVRPDGA